MKVYNGNCNLEIQSSQLNMNNLFTCKKKYKLLNDSYESLSYL